MADIYIKIHRGTGKLTGQSLCKTCTNSMIWTDARGEHTTCNTSHPNWAPQGKVLDCSDYYSSTLPSLRDMRETAWTLRTEKGGKAIGFTPPKKKKDDDD